MKRAILYSALALVLLWLPLCLLGAADSMNLPPDHDRLLAKAVENGDINIIVKLKVDNLQHLTRQSTRFRQVKPGQRFPNAGREADARLAAAIGQEADRLLNELEGMEFRLNHRYNAFPYLAMTVPAETLALLQSLPRVEKTIEDHLRRLPPSMKHQTNKLSQTNLLNSTELTGARSAWALGYSGKGWYVAVLDTGILRTHEFFQGKTIIEACYSSEKDCPNNKSSMTGSGSAAPFDSSYDGYDHGTHVAGIAAGNNGMDKFGVAKDSNIIMVQVFSKFSAEDCGDTPCIASWDSDQIKGLDYVYSLRSTYSIASVNMSLGGGSFSSYCNEQSQTEAIDMLKAVGIATIVATGNDYACGVVSAPACIESAVAVGASNNEDSEAVFNNYHPTLQEFFAPGSFINSSVASSDTAYAYKSGTSMAAPHVAGAWAILKQAVPNASVDTVFSNLQETGTPIASSWCGSRTVPRPNIDTALVQMITAGGGTSAISLNRSELYFNAVSGGAVSSPQQVSISIDGGSTENWTVSTDKSWLNCSPGAGGKYGIITVSVNPAGLAQGNYSGRVSITAIGAANSPEMFNVYLNVIAASQDQLPFGTLATPVNGATLSGSIPVTGWALDDIGIDKVEIYNGVSYVGEAVFIEGARPDVQTSYSDYPHSYKAGWGYMLLTYFLPGGGNGKYTLTARAIDVSGNSVNLGSTTINLNNSARKKPFGAIDTPAQGETISDDWYINWGWVLTPQPNYIPSDGSTINVWIDGKNIGHPVYNINRSDLAAFFPGYANSEGAAGYLRIYTGSYANGLHTIQWTTADNAGNSDGIGSRYFLIQRNGGLSVSQYYSPNPGLVHSKKPVHRTLPVEIDMRTGVRVNPVNTQHTIETNKPDQPVKLSVVTGTRLNPAARDISSDRQGICHIEIHETERLEIHFKEHTQAVLSLTPLPTGSTLDGKNGIFYWLPGPGYVGTYDFEFILRKPSGVWIPAAVRIFILPQGRIGTDREVRESDLNNRSG